MENFQSLGLPEDLLACLQAMKFEKPTEIQHKTIPYSLEGLDILGSAQTGTGKTGAYGIPLIAYLMANPDACALVLTPTRELAVQVLITLRKMISKKSAIGTALLIGGDCIRKQNKELARKPRLIVGTPGRVNDPMARVATHLSKTTFLVLDETDKMLDMGFSIQLEKIVDRLPADRQTLMFSATMDKSIETIAKNYLKDNAVRISVGSTSSPAERVTQEIIRTTEAEKFDLLVNKISEINDVSVIVFVKTKIDTEKVAMRLREQGLRADAIHGDLRQRQRDRVIKAFRERKNKILVATDIAARGLDIPHLECVINYDLPQCPEDYIHRIGRTGRAGAEGKAVSLVSSRDQLKWRNICRLINPQEKQKSEHKTNRPHSGGYSDHKKPWGKEKSFGARRSNEQSFDKNRRFGKPYQDSEKSEYRGDFYGKRFEDKKPVRNGEYRSDERKSYRSYDSASHKNGENRFSTRPYSQDDQNRKSNSYDQDRKSNYYDQDRKSNHYNQDRKSNHYDNDRKSNNFSKNNQQKKSFKGKNFENPFSKNTKEFKTESKKSSHSAA